MINKNSIMLFLKIVNNIIISLIFFIASIIIFLIVINNSNIEMRLNIKNKPIFYYEIFFNKNRAELLNCPLFFIIYCCTEVIKNRNSKVYFYFL